MKTLIYTACFIQSYESYESLIWEWLISLRTLGNYKGEVVIFDYGMPDILVEELKNFKLGPPTIIKLPERNAHSTTNYRNIDVIPHLEKYKDYSFSMFDFDIWFQRDVNKMFDELEDEGCYHGVEPGRTCRYRGPDNSKTRAEYEKQYDLLNGFIYGGWYAGKYKPYLEKLRKMKHCFENGWKVEEWGADQSVVTYLADVEKDKLEGLIYGCSRYFCEEKDEMLKCVTLYNDKHENEDVIGVHLGASSSVTRGLEYENSWGHIRFKYRYPELWKQYR